MISVEVIYWRNNDYSIDLILVYESSTLKCRHWYGRAFRISWFEVKLWKVVRGGANGRKNLVRHCWAC